MVSHSIRWRPSRVALALGGAVFAGVVLATVWGSTPAHAEDEPRDGLLDTVGSALSPALEKVTPVLDTVVEPVTPVLDTVVEPVTPVLDTVVEPVTPVVAPVVETLEPITGTLTPVTEALQPVVEPVAAAVRPVTETLTPVTDSLQPVVESLEPVTGALQPVTGALDPVTQPVVDVLGSVLTPVVPVPITSDDAVPSDPVVVDIPALTDTDTDAATEAADAATATAEALHWAAELAVAFRHPAAVTPVSTVTAATVLAPASHSQVPGVPASAVLPLSSVSTGSAGAGPGTEAVAASGPLVAHPAWVRRAGPGDDSPPGSPAFDADISPD